IVAQEQSQVRNPRLKRRGLRNGYVNLAIPVKWIVLSSHVSNERIIMNISSQIARRFVRLGLLGFIIPLLIACGIGGNTNPTATSNTTPAIAGTITEFPVGSNPSG